MTNLAGIAEEQDIPGQKGSSSFDFCCISDLKRISDSPDFDFETRGIAKFFIMQMEYRTHKLVTIRSQYKNESDLGEQILILLKDYIYQKFNCTYEDISKKGKNDIQEITERFCESGYLQRFMEDLSSLLDVTDKTIENPEGRTCEKTTKTFDFRNKVRNTIESLPDRQAFISRKNSSSKGGICLESNNDSGGNNFSRLASISKHGVE